MAPFSGPAGREEGSFWWEWKGPQVGEQSEAWSGHLQLWFWLPVTTGPALSLRQAQETHTSVHTKPEWLPLLSKFHQSPAEAPLSSLRPQRAPSFTIIAHNTLSLSLSLTKSKTSKAIVQMKNELYNSNFSYLA